MFHYCLDLGLAGGGGDDALQVVFALSLLIPWLLAAAYWALSFVFYDSSILAASVVLNYALYGVIFFLASNWGIASPRALPCGGLSAFFFDGYRYMWPSPLLITLFAYLFFLGTRHVERSSEWWPGYTRYSILRRAISTLNVLLPVVYLLAGLWYLEISTTAFLLANLAVGAALGVCFSLFLLLNAWWQRCGQALDHSLGWEAPPTRPLRF